MIKKWVTRIGVVGSTARWVAKVYIALKKKHPSVERTDLYRAMIGSRYKVMPNPDRELVLLDLAGRVDGLANLTVAILIVEAQFSDNTIENQELFREVINEELLKYGIPKDDVIAH